MFTFSLAYTTQIFDSTTTVPMEAKVLNATYEKNEEEEGDGDEVQPDIGEETFEACQNGTFTKEERDLVVRKMQARSAENLLSYNGTPPYSTATYSRGSPR